MITQPALDLLYLSKSHRRAAILYTRLKTSLSSLNRHLYDHRLIDNPECSCASVSETTSHCLCDCTYYDTQRERLIFELNQLDLPNLLLTTLLNRSSFTNDESLIYEIQQAIYTFIQTTNRFHSRKNC
jgi:hypothetical protein